MILGDFPNSLSFLSIFFLSCPFLYYQTVLMKNKRKQRDMCLLGRKGFTASGSASQVLVIMLEEIIVQPHPRLLPSALVSSQAMNWAAPLIHSREMVGEVKLSVLLHGLAVDTDTSVTERNRII